MCDVVALITQHDRQPPPGSCTSGRSNRHHSLPAGRVSDSQYREATDTSQNDRDAGVSLYGSVGGHLESNSPEGSGSAQPYCVIEPNITTVEVGQRPASAGFDRTLSEQPCTASSALQPVSMSRASSAANGENLGEINSSCNDWMDEDSQYVLVCGIYLYSH